MQRVYSNTVPGAESIHIEILPEEIGDLVADLRSTGRVTARSERLIRILEASRVLFDSIESKPYPVQVSRFTPPPATGCESWYWQAWWEDFDGWDGFIAYEQGDIRTAFHCAAYDYLGEEYGWDPRTASPDDEDPDVQLNWQCENGRWYLCADGKPTGVQLYKVHIHKKEQS